MAGAAGTRSEFNGDLVISDYVLQKGYAYASQNKGTMNYRPTDKSNLNVSCPLHPVADAVAGSAANPLLYFALLDNENSLIEWGERINQAALIAKALIEEHYDANHLVPMPWGYRTVATKCAKPSKITQRPSTAASSGKRFCGNATVRTSLASYRLA